MLCNGQRLIILHSRRTWSMNLFSFYIPTYSLNMLAFSPEKETFADLNPLWSLRFHPPSTEINTHQYLKSVHIDLNVKIWVGLLTPYDQPRQFRQKLSKSCFCSLKWFPEWQHCFVIDMKHGHCSYIEFFRVHILRNFSESVDWINKEFLLADIGDRVASSLSSWLVSHSFHWIVIPRHTSFKTWLILFSLYCN